MPSCIPFIDFVAALEFATESSRLTDYFFLSSCEVLLKGLLKIIFRVSSSIKGSIAFFEALQGRECPIADLMPAAFCKAREEVQAREALGMKKGTRSETNRAHDTFLYNE